MAAASKTHKESIALIGKAHYSEAIVKLKELVQHSSLSMEILLLLAQSYLNLKEYDMALLYLGLVDLSTYLLWPSLIISSL